MRRLIKWSALSCVLSLAALVLTAPVAQAQKAGFCDGGTCCGDNPAPPGYTCTLNGPGVCTRGSESCTEDCSWNCVQN